MKRILSLSLIGLIGIVLDSNAQNAQVSHTITVEIQKSASLRLKPNTVIQDNFIANTPEEMMEGMENETAGVYQVQSNDQWIVQVSTPQATWHYQGEGENPSMPVDFLQVRSSQQSLYSPLSQEGKTLAQGQPGDFGGENEFGIDYKIQTGLDFPAGTYQTDVSFTVSNP